MTKILIVGCGDLGTAIALQLQQSQHEVTGLRISSKKLPNGMQTIQADVTHAHSLTMLNQLQPEIIVYSVAASAQTDENYHAHYVEGLKNVLATQAENNQLKHVFFVSSTRVYGQKTDNILDENTPALPADFGGKRLLEAENLLSDLPCAATILRLSGIYGEGRLSLINLAKDLHRWPVTNNWINRIHRDDAATFIKFLVRKSLADVPVYDCYIVTDDQPTLQYEVLNWLANQQGIDASHKPIPTVRTGKRLSNDRLRESGFQLQYPHYQIGYKKVLESI